MEAAIANMAQAFGDKAERTVPGAGCTFPYSDGRRAQTQGDLLHPCRGLSLPGNLKHGPLALVDEKMPVVAVAPNDLLIEKLKSNLEEVRARGGRLYLFADPGIRLRSKARMFEVLHVAPVDSAIAPIIYTVPLQLLSYHVALIKGTDVDKPRNLAKSVTVE